MLWQSEAKGAQITAPRMLQLADIQVPKEWLVDMRALRQLEGPRNMTTIAQVQETYDQARISFASTQTSYASSRSQSRSDASTSHQPL